MLNLAVGILFVGYLLIAVSHFIDGHPEKARKIGVFFKELVLNVVSLVR